VGWPTISGGRPYPGKSRERGEDRNSRHKKRGETVVVKNEMRSDGKFSARLKKRDATSFEAAGGTVHPNTEKELTIS